MDGKDCKPPAAKKARVVSPAKDSAVGSAAGNNIGAHILPPECFGHALSFLPYSDVRSASRTGRYLAFQAAREVDTINIYSPSEMNVRAGFKRFPNVTQVNIFCLQHRYGTPPYHEGPSPASDVSKEAVERTVLFLSAFPNLEGTYVGGIIEEWDRKLEKLTIKECPVSVFGSSIDRHNFNKSKNKTMKALLANMCSAFKVGALPSNLKIDGLVKMGLAADTSYVCPVAMKDSDLRDDGGCELCRSICQNFPIHSVCELENFAPYRRAFRRDFCIGETNKLDILRKRSGWKEYTSKFCVPLEMALRNSFIHAHVDKFFNAPKNDMAIAFKRDLVRRRIPLQVYSLLQDYTLRGPSCEAFLSHMISRYGFRPGLIDPSDLAEMIGEGESYKFVKKERTQSHAEVLVDTRTFGILSSLGFNVKNLIVVDKIIA